MGHINDQVSTDKVSDLAHALVVDQTAVGRSTSDKNLWSVHEGIGLKSVVVDDTSLKVDTVWESLEVGRDSRNLSLRCLVAVGQVTAVRKIEAHESVVGSHDSLVDLKVCWRTRQALNIDAPFFRINIECLESTSLAGQFDGINVLVSTIVSGAWVSLGVLVGHWRSKGIEHGAGGNIFGGDEDDGLALTLDLEFLCNRQYSRFQSLEIGTHHDLCDLWVSLQEGLLQQL